MSLLKNNVLSLMWYVGIEIGVYVLMALSLQLFGYLKNSWELFFLIPILIATPLLFILTGRYALKTHGSSIKDLISVLLVCIIGLLLTPGMAYYIKPPGENYSINSFYFLYVTPFDVTIQFFKNDWTTLMIGKGVPGLISGGVCSFIPTLLMWIGLRWQSRKRSSE